MRRAALGVACTRRWPLLLAHRSRLVSSAAARESYSPWSFLPHVEPAGPRETRAPPPPLPSPRYLDVQGRCRLEYVDVQPLEDAWRGHETPVTLVLVHGAPGSYQDFRHFIPVLAQQPHMRIIGVTLPGYGGSTVTAAHCLEDISALPTAQLTLDAVRQLCGGQEGSSSVFLVGHSFGAHTAINMAALNAADRANNAINFRGLALLAPAGCRPHRILRPRESAFVVQLLRSGNPVITSMTPYLIKAIYTKLLQFPNGQPPLHYLAGLVRAGTTDFSVVRRQVDELRRLRTPTFIAWSQNDEYMEAEIPEELAKLCHAGPRIAFAGGGHNIQKTRTERLAVAMAEWIERIVADENEEEQPTHLLP